ncbi:uncharacterized protein LOC129609932 [Condylostylus longicornis]|uniref:uncharacterized protein LOC129609932 n=1 Tax=Condylostylus longicornis TaxID=2530218 RepID=UPI00244E5943|nr:uncharacterized protein LOC129609932 [Condylostylus longicornis]
MLNELFKMKEINIFKYLLLTLFIIILLFPYEYDARTETTQRSVITPTTVPPSSVKSASTNSINTATATTNANKENTSLKKSQSAPELIDKSSSDFIDGLFPKRQFDLRISADHDQQVGTDLVAEAIAKLWRSKSGNTQIEGTAKIAHHTGPFSSQGSDWRIGLNVVFT